MRSLTALLCSVLFLSVVNAQTHATVTDDTINLTGSSAKKKPRQFTFNPAYDVFIERYSAKYSVDPFLVKCIIKVESDFNPNAVSSAGAVGLMQLMQETARDYGVTNRTDPELNIRAGIQHLAFLLRECEGEVPLAVAAYHAGLGRVKRNHAVPPIQSTIEYVNMVMTWYAGEADYSSYVKRLYKIISSDGTINFTNQ
jgi:soluble lytic murein transglycosylase-like protein